MANDLRSVFRESAAEFLLELEQALLHLSNNPDEMSEIDRLFRVMHTIKGSAAMVDLNDVSHFAHKLESECDFLRQGQARVTPDLIHLALCAHDCISSLIDSHYGGEPVDEEHLAGILQKFSEARQAATIKKSSAASSPERTLELLKESCEELMRFSKSTDRKALINSAGQKITQIFFLLLIQNRESAAEFISQLEIVFRKARCNGLIFSEELVQLAVEMLSEAEALYKDNAEVSEDDFDPEKLLLALQRPLELNQRLTAIAAALEGAAGLPPETRTFRINVSADERGPGSLSGPDRFEKVLARLGDNLSVKQAGHYSAPQQPAEISAAECEDSI
ncbi:MAG: Hpt domain-containing protein [Candidatus Riflebacteria bacterium]|jgi:HPt (histidine-containing phosphotransfer) domain-containing protein|nr:Hpt domain-containing protein [Candidatus Riflebacteria bacterium]